MDDRGMDDGGMDGLWVAFVACMPPSCQQSEAVRFQKVYCWRIDGINTPLTHTHTHRHSVLGSDWQLECRCSDKGGNFNFTRRHSAQCKHIWAANHQHTQTHAHTHNVHNLLLKSSACISASPRRRQLFKRRCGAFRDGRTAARFWIFLKITYEKAGFHCVRYFKKKKISARVDMTC